MLTAKKFSFLCFKDSLRGKQDCLTLKIEPNENSMTHLALNNYFILFMLYRIIFEMGRLC